MTRRRLAVYCWCQRLIVWVPAGDVQAGLTGHCKRRGCMARDREERALVAA